MHNLTHNNVGFSFRLQYGCALPMALLITIAGPVFPIYAQVGDSDSPSVPTATDETALSDEGRIKELGERVEGLKERVHESKSRLMLLKEQILHDVIAEAQVTLVHRNELGPSVIIESVRYTLDGVQIYFQTNSGSQVLDQSRQFQLFGDTLVPGNHVLAVEMVLRGDGGLFSYVDGYRFRIRSQHRFFAPKAKMTRIEVVVFEKGGELTTLEDRPSVRYDTYEEDAVPSEKLGDAVDKPDRSSSQ